MPLQMLWTLGREPNLFVLNYFFSILLNNSNRHKMTTCRILKSISACFLFSIFLLLKGTAQSSTPMTIKTPWGNRTIWTPNATGFHTYHNQGFVNRKHNFTIVLLNDSSFQVRAKINIEDSINSIKWGKGEEQHIVVPSQTKEIYRTSIYGKLRGIPRDSCWLFLVKEGKVSTYSISSEMDNPLINYIQKGESGEILPLLPINVENMVNDNKKALALAKKGKLLRAIEMYNLQ